MATTAVLKELLTLAEEPLEDPEFDAFEALSEIASILRVEIAKGE